MTFYHNVVLTKLTNFVFQMSLCIAWIYNDSMYVRFGGIRNTETWSKSRAWAIKRFTTHALTPED